VAVCVTACVTAYVCGCCFMCVARPVTLRVTVCAATAFEWLYVCVCVWLCVCGCAIGRVRATVCAALALCVCACLVHVVVPVHGASARPNVRRPVRQSASASPPAGSQSTGLPASRSAR
jgi:hypothetical protein